MLFFNLIFKTKNINKIGTNENRSNYTVFIKFIKFKILRVINETS